MSVEEVCHALDTNPHDGLSEKEAKERLQTYGPNQLPQPKKTSIFKLFICQFKSLIVWILIAASLIAFFLGDRVDVLVILSILILNALIGIFQEYKAESSLLALRKLGSPTSKIIRNGNMRIVASKDIVPGDLIVLEAGDRIPADGRIIQSTQLMTQEASLTGESMPIHKEILPYIDADLPLADRKNMGFMGTLAVSGKGLMVATKTALNTEMGKIASLLQESKEIQTPLQKRLDQFGLRLVWLCFGIVALVFALGLVRNTPLKENLFTSISLAVAAIPEGLPAIVTIALALGVRRMAMRQALIRRLSSVETLGCTTVILTDKTGTLTQNEMVVKNLWVNEEFIDVTGIGYQPDGSFEINHTKINPHDMPELILALKIGTLCNSAELHGSIVSGDPTEGALLTAAAKAGLDKSSLDKEFPRIEEIPFDSDRKRMSMIRKGRDGPLLYIKGAPDLLVKFSDSIALRGAIHPLTEEHKMRILETNAYLAGQALRVLALGYRPLPSKEEFGSPVEEHLVFVGLVAMYDPPRPEVKCALETCKKAGVTPVMITGDHQDTAIAVAKELNMWKSDSQALTGAELDHMDDAALMAQVRKIAVYARTSASHKLRIVKAWKALGDVVAMTGDGVNDAPAIKAADIGVAMGMTGTDVTKEASDMVIMDDNFTSIVNAIEEGRGIYDNIIKFVGYLISTNLAELLIILAVMLMGITDSMGRLVIPLTALQILWVNLVSDGFPAMALSLDPVDPKAMMRAPRKLHEPIFSFRLTLQLIFVSCAIALGSLTAYAYGLRQSAELAQTMTFTTLVLLELISVQFIRSQYHLRFLSNPVLLIALAFSFLLQLVLLYTPFLQQAFRTVPLSLTHWSVILAIAVAVGVFNQLMSKKKG